jgi:hypothetical protein
LAASSPFSSRVNGSACGKEEESDVTLARLLDGEVEGPGLWPARKFDDSQSRIKAPAILDILFWKSIWGRYSNI